MSTTHPTDARRPKVLLVDDEEDIILPLLEVLYRDNRRYDVLLASTAEIAQQILTEIRVDVIVTDIHLPGKSGMDLLSWAAIERPDTRFVVMTAFDATGIKDRAYAFGCLRMMRKPFDVHEMRATIGRALDHHDAFAGTLSELSAVDVIQMLCIAKKTTALRFSENDSAGAVYIEQGEPVHAAWGTRVGEDAFYRMMAVKSGVFHTSPLPADLERTITSAWQYLLMEGLRRLDEAARDQDDNGSPRTLPSGQLRSDGAAVSGPTSPSASGSWRAAPPDGQARSVSSLIDEGFEMVRAGRRDEARTAWEEALRLDPGNRRVELNLRRLNGAPVAVAGRR